MTWAAGRETINLAMVQILGAGHTNRERQVSKNSWSYEPRQVREAAWTASPSTQGVRTGGGVAVFMRGITASTLWRQAG